jgi:hypothetical protein
VSARVFAIATALLSAAAVIALGLAILAPVTASGVGAAQAATTAPSSGAVDRYPAESLSMAIVGRDVFRRGRLPATLAYDPNRSLVSPGTASPKPQLQLVGLTSGAQPSAVIEGFPGVEGSRVVRAGDQVGVLRVIAIKSDVVTIVGLDTTWILRVREPWK